MEPVQTLILLAVLANLAVMGAVVLPPLLGRRGPLPNAPIGLDTGERASADLAVVGDNRDSHVNLTDLGDVTPGAYDRVVRIVSWVFILATSTIIAVTGLWVDNQAAIFALLAAAGLFVLVVHDLLPAGALGTAKFVHTPKPSEIAEHLAADVEDVVEALACNGAYTPSSLDLCTGEAGTSTLGDRIGTAEPDLLQLEDRLALAPAVRRLTDRDRRIIRLRYFEDWTQQQIGADLGLSQVQVSRTLARIMRDLRNELTAG